MNLSEEKLSYLVAEIVPPIYEKFSAFLREEDWVGLSADPSHNSENGQMTADMYAALSKVGLPCRREYHEATDGRLSFVQFVIVHALPDEAPSEEDAITDLNPWQRGPINCRGYLHGKRSIVRKTLASKGVWPVFCALRAVETIVVPHTTALMPADVRLEQGK